MTDYPYVWTWKTKLPDRRGQRFRLLIRGTAMNSCLIQFEDGWKVVTSRNVLGRKHLA